MPYSYVFKRAIYYDSTGSQSITLDALKIIDNINVLFKWNSYYISMIMVPYCIFQIIFDLNSTIHTGLVTWTQNTGNITVSLHNDINIITISPISSIK